MRVSQYFGLNRTQATLDFVDVDTYGDTPLFVDPRALERTPGEWAESAVERLREFFERVLAAIGEGRRADGLVLLRGLGEPNETHLGLSRGRARGSAIGPRLAEQLWDALSQSEAAHTGLLRDLEDTALLIEGIDIDRVSDITTNLIREHLITYTQDAADYYGIPLEEVGSGPTWDPDTGVWEPEHYVRLPATETGPLLLVPKAIVRMKLDFDPGEYYRKYILRHLAELELQRPGSSLVYTLKGTGEKRVRKTQLDERTRRTYNTEKRANIRVTLSNNGELLRQYRADKERPGNQRDPLTLLEFSAKTGSAPPDWNALLATVLATPTGGANASAYHRNAEALLTALFWPTLTYMRIESELHQGRKRVDLRYTNLAISGFFAWVANNYPPQPYIFVECKNYSADLGNDALDQLAGRFNPATRGNVGLLVCRRFADKERFIQRCRDTALDGRGYILVIDDADLTALTHARRDDEPIRFFGILDERFSRLVT